MKYTPVFLLAGMLFFLKPGFSQNLYTFTSTKLARQKLTRTDNGKPGKDYWQNSGDYDIRVNFDPATNLLSGEEQIVYSNNSPDTLKRLVLRLFPDLYKKGVSRSGNIADKDLNEGVSIEQLIIGTETITGFTDIKKAFHSNTNLVVLPKSALLPHSTTILKVKWHYTVNTGSQVRTGMVDSGSYFIAYFFPRLAVYDDINGWDEWSYNGNQEFYNDFGKFNVEINLPNIILRSPLAVFTTLYRPFLWESNKPIMFLSALESALILLATVYLLVKCRISKFFYYIFTDPYIFFCFTFSILLGVIVGFSTFNFGTMVRYRLPILPFYFFMLLLIYIKIREARKPVLL